MRRTAQDAALLTSALLGALALIACGSGGGADATIQIAEGGALPVAPEPIPPDPEAEGTAIGAEGLATAVETPPEPTPPAAPRSLPKPVTTQVGANGATLVTGAFRAVIPALAEVTEVTFTAVDEATIRTPRPLSTILAAAELTPSYRITESMIRLTLPMRERVEPGTDVQLLTYSRSMQAFFVVAEARVSGEGTATFSTDMFSQYVVIARPELRETLADGLQCDVPIMALNERHPGPGERTLIGEVEESERLSRDDAFRLLTDLRAFPDSALIVFKNEELDFSGENGRPVCHDEDYLVDPALAEPTLWLGRAVQAAWVDPIGGGPAFQLRVTDSYDSLIEHSRRSNHYRGRAIDLTLSPVPAGSAEARRDYYGQLARLSACAGYDFVHFENRHHIHASSRGTIDERALVQLGGEAPAQEGTP